MYYKGELIPQNIDKAKEYLLKYVDSDNGEIFAALGNIYSNDRILQKLENSMKKDRINTIQNQHIFLGKC